MKNNIEIILERDYSFYNKLNTEEKDEFWNSLSNVRRNMIFKEDLELNGFGINKIKIDEYNYSSFDLNIEKTLYDVDYKEFLFQKSESSESLGDYNCYLQQVFYKMIYRNQFYQGYLYNLNLFVYEEICENLDNFTDNIFNTEVDMVFIEKEENTLYSTVSFNNKYYFSEDKVELFDRWFLEYKNKLSKEINLNKNKKFKNKCFIEMKKNLENEDTINIIFSDEKVCKKINFDSFMENVEEYSGSFLLIENYVKDFVENEKKVLLEKIKKIFN